MSTMSWEVVINISVETDEDGIADRLEEVADKIREGYTSWFYGDYNWTLR